MTSVLLAKLKENVIPIARAKSAKWASEYAEARFIKVWAKVEQGDGPEHYNDVWEVFSDQSERRGRKSARWNCCWRTS